MPRVKILSDKYATDDLRAAIRMGIAKIGAKDYMVASQIGMTPPTFCHRKSSPDGFKISEIRDLYRARVLTEEDILKYVTSGKR